MLILNSCFNTSTIHTPCISSHPSHYRQEVQPALPKQRELETLGDYNRRLQQAVKEKLQVGLPAFLVCWRSF